MTGHAREAECPPHVDENRVHTWSGAFCVDLPRAVHSILQHA